MISDFVKGRSKNAYPAEIRKGIELHRMIDRFTDDHAATADAKVFFRPAYRLYSGAFVDVVYDHFLANDRSIFDGDDALLQFSRWVYSRLGENYEILPATFAAMLPFMKSSNWLYEYRLISGIHSSFRGLVRRARYMHDAGPACSILDEHYDELRGCYHRFFPDVTQYAQEALRNLMAS